MYSSLRAYDFRQQRTIDLLKFSQWRHWNQILSIFPLFYRPSCAQGLLEANNWAPLRQNKWRLVPPSWKFLILRVWPPVCPRRRNPGPVWVFSRSRGLSKALDRKAQISMKTQSQADPNSAVWKKSEKSEQHGDQVSDNPGNRTSKDGLFVFVVVYFLLLILQKSKHLKSWKSDLTIKAEFGRTDIFTH